TQSTVTSDSCLPAVELNPASLAAAGALSFFSACCPSAGVLPVDGGGWGDETLCGGIGTGGVCAARSGEAWPAVITTRTATPQIGLMGSPSFGHVAETSLPGQRISSRFPQGEFPEKGVTIAGEEEKSSEVSLDRPAQSRKERWRAGGREPPRKHLRRGRF